MVKLLNLKNYKNYKNSIFSFLNYFLKFSDAMNTNGSFIHKDTYKDDTSDSAQEIEVTDEDEQNNTSIGNKNNNNLGSLLNRFQVDYASGLGSIFPTLHLALKIACTLPVSSTTPEQTFSKLKIVKNHLRATISPDR